MLLLACGLSCSFFVNPNIYIYLYVPYSLLRSSRLVTNSNPKFSPTPNNESHERLELVQNRRHKFSKSRETPVRPILKSQVVKGKIFPIGYRVPGLGLWLDLDLDLGIVTGEKASSTPILPFHFPGLIISQPSAFHFPGLMTQCSNVLGPAG